MVCGCTSLGGGHGFEATPGRAEEPEIPLADTVIPLRVRVGKLL
jgi:hypothetical protein